MGKQRKKTSTQRLTEGWVLVDIPVLSEHEQTCWKIKCLGRAGPDGQIHSPVLEQLLDWEKNKNNEFKKLLRAIRYGGANQVHQNPNLIRQDEKKRGGYEFKNTSCSCRLFFFYDRRNDQIIICTNAYWKGGGAKKGEQDHQFERCSKLKALYQNEEP